MTILKQSGGGEISSSAICGALAISRTAVWKHIKALREQGYRIEGQSRCGYRLVQSPDLPVEGEVAPLLTTGRLGRTILYKEQTGSTNIDAAEAAGQGCLEGCVCCAGAQSAGRGRMNRQWFSPPGVNLYFSMVLRPGVPIGNAASLPLVAGIAVASALESVDARIRPRVKWPNDILVQGKKICGILCEMQAEIDCGVKHVVVGVGIDVNLDLAAMPPELRETATSLRIESGRECSRAALLASVLNAFEPLYDLWREQGFAPLAVRMERYDALAGRRISIRQGRETLVGTACGVQDDGALKLKTASGVIPVYSGEATVEKY